MSSPYEGILSGNARGLPQVKHFDVRVWVQGQLRLKGGGGYDLLFLSNALLFLPAVILESFFPRAQGRPPFLFSMVPTLGHQIHACPTEE